MNCYGTVFVWKNKVIMSKESDVILSLIPSRGSFILIIVADELLPLQNLTPVIYQVFLKFRYLDIITYRTTTSQSVYCHSWGNKILNLKACLISVFLQTSLLVIFNQTPVAYSSHLHHVASSNVSNTWFIVTLIYSSPFH